MHTCQKNSCSSDLHASDKSILTYVLIQHILYYVYCFIVKQLVSREAIPRLEGCDFLKKRKKKKNHIQSKTVWPTRTLNVLFRQLSIILKYSTTYVYELYSRDSSKSIQLKAPHSGWRLSN